MIGRSRKYKTGTKWCLWRFTDVDSAYIVRLHLLKTPWFAICLHWLLKPDPEPYLHDHPVSFFSLVLRGWYIEEREHDTERRWPNVCRWYNRIRATPRDRHSIRAVGPETLTLCLMGPKVREWGYHTKKGWVYWKNYNAALKAVRQTAGYVNLSDHDKKQVEEFAISLLAEGDRVLLCQMAGVIAAGLGPHVPIRDGVTLDATYEAIVKTSVQIAKAIVTEVDKEKENAT